MTYPRDLQYTREHEWARLEGDVEGMQEHLSRVEDEAFALDVRLEAAEGPFGTRDYHIALEAAPLDATLVAESDDGIYFPRLIMDPNWVRHLANLSTAFDFEPGRIEKRTSESLGLAAAGGDVALVIHLGEVYGFRLSRREASRLLLTISAQLVALMGAYWGMNLVSSALKTASADLRAGAGGVDAADFTDMLLRMYQRWAEEHDYQTELLEVSPGEEAGIPVAGVTIDDHAGGGGGE